MRKQVTHTGGLELPEFVQEAPPGQFTIRDYIYAKEIEEEIAVTEETCQEGYSSVENIVDEAEKKFSVKLS